VFSSVILTLTNLVSFGTPPTVSVSVTFCNDGQNPAVNITTSPSPSLDSLYDCENAIPSIVPSRPDTTYVNLAYSDSCDSRPYLDITSRYTSLLSAANPDKSYPGHCTIQFTYLVSDWQDRLTTKSTDALPYTDTKLPTATQKTSFECGTSTDPLHFGGASDVVPYTVQDNCFPVPDSMVNLVPGYTKHYTCGAAYTAVLNYTITDFCGNTLYRSDLFNVVDTHKAIFTSAVETVVTYDCTAGGTVYPPAVTEACATGVGGRPGPVFTYVDSLTTWDCSTGSATVYRTWYVHDGCNTANPSSVGMQLDITHAPSSYSTPASRTLTCSDSTDPLPTDTPFTCGTLGVFGSNYTDSYTCSASGTASNLIIQRTWTPPSASPACNTGAGSQNLTLTVPVTWFNVTDIYLPCGADTSPTITPTFNITCTLANQILSALATLSGTPATTQHSDSPSVTSCGGGYVFNRTWSINIPGLTGCSGFAPIKQQIWVAAAGNSNFTYFPPAVTLECGNSTFPTNTGTPIAVAQCGPGGVRNVTATYNDTITYVCGAAGSITRTWTADSGCNNGTAVVATQIITIYDTTPPRAPSPAPPSIITVPCTQNVTVLGYNPLNFTDVCGNVTSRYVDSPVSPCVHGLRSFTRTWNITDQCGQVTLFTQLYNVTDFVPPAFSPPPVPLINVQCFGNGYPYTSFTPTPPTTDNCSPYTNTSYTDARNMICGYSEGITRTWKAVDDCGNVQTTVQQLNMIDSTPPFLSLAPVVVFECVSGVVPITSGISSDACSPLGSVVSTYSDVYVLVSPCETQISRTFTTTDACGLVSYNNQLVIIRDTTPPEWVSFPATSIVLECLGIPGVTTAQSGIAVGRDNCDPVPLTSFSDSVPDPHCGLTFSIVRTWRVVDRCGLFITKPQAITLIDTTPPIAKPPASVELECGGSGALPTSLPTTVDGCSAPNTVRLIATESQAQGACGGEKILVRSWAPLDQCSNQGITVTQGIYYRDLHPPSLTVTNPAPVACDGSAAPLLYPTVSDTCITPSLSYVDRYVSIKSFLIQGSRTPTPTPNTNTNTKH
jgi:large repetitive protein